MGCEFDEKKYYAHTKEGKPESEWQTVEEHTNEVARLAGDFANNFNAKNWGINVSLLHDLGKYQEEFQARIKGKNIHIDHATSGARWALNSGISNKAFAKILAYCIAGHHTGLPDGSSGTDDTCLDSKLDKAKLPEYFPPIKTVQLDMPDVLKNIEDISKSPSGFSVMFFTRMLFSCLKDADCLDTEAFMDAKKADKRGKHASLIELKKKFDLYMKHKKSNAVHSEINNCRNEILAECIKASEQSHGLFSLTVPTGGGKTLSSIAFALNHALLHKLDRIIYVIPYISIIEQTAKEFKIIFGDENVIEHHSNIAPSDIDDDYKNEAELRRLLATENWDAPIIVTTNLQFFESLFHNKTSRVRKIHNIVKSVVILDEAQMLPVPFLMPTIEAIRELSTKYNTSIVLCTATQPALNDKELKGGLSNVREMITNPTALEAVFKRVKTQHLDICPDIELVEKIKSHKQVLCIVNTRAHARKLIVLLGKEDGHFHLSALMCPEHRFKVLKIIRERLLIGHTCRVISTQLVEAGVDIDFPVVYRAIAGVDSIVQSAGRCNREGKITNGGLLFVFTPESGLPRGIFRQNAEITQSVLRDFGDNLLSSNAVRTYFNDLYWRKSLGDRNNTGLDEEGILTVCREGEAKLDLPFKTVAGKYNLIKNAMESIIIPYDKRAIKLINELRSAQQKGKILRSLQRYIVQVYPEQIAKLKNEGFIEIIDESYFILAEVRFKEAYCEEFGLNPEFNEFLNPDEIII